MIFQIISPAPDAFQNLVVALICLCVAISALILGRPVERAGGLFLTVSMGVHVLFESVFLSWGRNIVSTELVLSVVDLSMFSTLAFRTYRLWPIIASGALFLISTVKALEWIGVDIGGFGDDRISTVLWITVPLLLLGSLIRSLLRRRFANLQEVRRK